MIINIDLVLPISKFQYLKTSEKNDLVKFKSLKDTLYLNFRYDYLEFTSSDGVKIKYDEKVGTAKWPKVVTLSNCQSLNFVFHSDASGNYWGYKFKVNLMIINSSCFTDTMERVVVVVVVV